MATIPLILAAGASSRMGLPKAGLRFGDATALELILRACCAAGLARPVIVVGAHPEIADGSPDALVALNSRWESGRASSIQAGLAAMQGVDAFLLWPVDCCLPGAGVLQALLAARRDRPRALAWIPSYDRRRGHPALLDRAVGERLAALTDDASARDVIRVLDAAGDLAHVEVDDPSVLMNMNTPQDYERWLAEFETRRAH